jgi:hypothetical protein
MSKLNKQYVLSSDLISHGQQLFTGLWHDTHKLFEWLERFAKLETEGHLSNTLQI